MKKYVAWLLILAMTLSVAGTGSVVWAAGGNGEGVETETAWAPYTTWQGQADGAGVWMTTPDPVRVETAGEIDKPSKAIHNRIIGEYDAGQDIVMAFDISGDGSNNYTVENFAANAGIYTKLRCVSEDRVLSGEQLNVVKTGERVGNQSVDSRKGSNIEITIPAGSLNPASVYYLNLAEGLGMTNKAGESYTIGTRIVFQFATAAEDAGDVVDKSKLKSAIAQAEALDASLYTQTTWQEMQDNLTEAKAAMESATVSQDDVDALCQYLQASITMLEWNEKGQLKAAIEKAESLDTGIYTKESVEVFNSAISAAKKALNAAGDADTLKKGYTEAKKNLEAAEAGLVPGEIPSLDAYPLSDYTTWQGKEVTNNSIGVYLVAPGKENGYTVKTANKVRHGAGYVWYNVIQESLDTPVEFVFYVTGNGINNLDPSGKTTFPYMHLYEDSSFTKEAMTGENQPVLNFVNIQKCQDGAKYPGFESTSRPGQLLTVSVDEGALKPGSDYYLVLGKDFQLNGRDRNLENEIIFKFHTAGDAIVKKMKSCKLSKTSYTYDGKAKKPTVTVKNDQGEVMVKDVDYTVSYASGRKNPGTYKVTVKGKGDYSFSKTLSFKILVKGTTITKLTAEKKSFTVTFKKQATGTTGYQVQYSTKKTFKSSKMVTYKGHKTLKRTVKELKAGTAYYVRVRTYVTISKKDYTSDWSEAKKITTKK